MNGKKWVNKYKPLCVSLLKRRPAGKVCTGLRRFQSIEISLNCGVIDAQKLICGSHHVDPVGLALSSFFVHKLVHRLVERSVLEIHTHNQEQSSAKCGRSDFTHSFIIAHCHSSVYPYK